MVDLVILIPAAGAASRMHGTDKLLEDVGGEPVLRRVTRLATETGATVLVALPDTGPYLPARRAAVMGLGARVVPVADSHEGMAASLRAGAQEIGPAEGLMVLLPDMPDIDQADLGQMISAFAEEPTVPLRATDADGTTDGHPVILPRRLMQELAVLNGDRGARVVLDGERIRRIPLPARHAVTDLDTPEDWAAWRAATAKEEGA